MKRPSLLALVLVALAASALVSGCEAVPFLAPPTSTPLPTATPTTVPTRTPAPTATPTPIPTSAPTAPPTPANPQAALTQIFKNWGAVKTFRATMVSTGAAAGNVTTNMEVVLPDRFHMTGSNLDMIKIGSAIYMKVQGKWQKAPATTGFDLSLTDPKALESQLTTTKDIKMVGAEVLDGAPTLVYTYTTTAKGPPAITTTNKLWVGALDGLPRKMESSSKQGQLTTITYTDYNAPITINAPI